MEPKAKNLMLFLLLGIAVLVSGCVQQGQQGQTDQSGNVQIANPASVYCVQNMSGVLTITDTPEGQVGYCNLPDGRICEEWELFRTGNCTVPA